MCGVLGHCRRHPSTWLPAGTPADGVWGRTRWSRGGFGSFARQIWLENGENLKSWILPGPGCPGEPKVGSHSDSVVSWDTVGGTQAFGYPQGPPQTGFGFAQDGPVEVLAALQGKSGWTMVKILQVGFCRTQGALTQFGPSGPQFGSEDSR